ncbi:MAG TPA: hypothetical protein VKR31_15760 [Rhizomicrobium sp.]|nr:hypothetical protein [Rhizomicrobium sp.]
MSSKISGAAIALVLVFAAASGALAQSDTGTHPPPPPPPPPSAPPPPPVPPGAMMHHHHWRHHHHCLWIHHRCYCPCHRR